MTNDKYQITNEFQIPNDKFQKKRHGKENQGIRLTKWTKKPEKQEKPDKPEKPKKPKKQDRSKISKGDYSQTG